MSPLNITQPLGIWSIMATIRWCPIFPKWDVYQPLKNGMFTIYQLVRDFAGPPSTGNFLLEKPVLPGQRRKIPSTCWSNEPRATRCKLAQTHPAKPFRSDMWLSGSAKPEQIPCKHLKLEVMDVVFWFQGLKWDPFQSSGNCYIHESSLGCYLAPSARISKDFP